MYHFFYLFAIFEVQSPEEHLEALISQAQYGSCKATLKKNVKKQNCRQEKSVNSQKKVNKNG